MRTRLAAGLAALAVSACAGSGIPFEITETGWPVADRAAIRTAFEEAMYGPWPGTFGLAIEAREDVEAFAGAGRLERLTLAIGTGTGRKRIPAALALPASASAGQPVAVVVFLTGWPDCQSFGVAELAPDGACEAVAPGFLRPLAGEHRRLLPVADYLAAGIAVATLDARQVLSDDAALARAEWQALTDGTGDPDTGSLMVWAAALAGFTQVLEADPRLDARRSAVAGFSRHGKSALLAAAFHPAPDLVFAHQSGFAGAALSRSGRGEGLARLTAPDSFPHWFSPALAAYADAPDTLPVDQHLLLALIAPRPLLLGNGRRDIWSDPVSTFEAAKSASPAWAAQGATGLTRPSMHDYDPAAGIGFFLRPGGHGLRPEDHAAFLAFLTAHGFGEPAGE